MELKASLKYVRVGVQRARLVADSVRGSNINKAISVLTFSKKKSATLIFKLLQSAIAQANNKEINVDKLYVKSIYVNQAPHLKRFRPAARGQSSPRNKKQSHIHVVLQEKVKGR